MVSDKCRCRVNQLPPVELLFLVLRLTIFPCAEMAYRHLVICHFFEKQSVFHHSARFHILKENQKVFTIIS